MHLELARQRIQLAVEELARVEVRVGIGTAPPLAREQPRLFVAESEVQVRRMELELEEINLSGRESRDDVSAPLVSGRDFVSERLGLEMQIERQRLEMVVAELQAQARRVEVGTMTPFELNGLQLAVGVAEDEDPVGALAREDRPEASDHGCDLGSCLARADLQVEVGRTPAELINEDL